jgi:hypothetical protein
VLRPPGCLGDRAHGESCLRGEGLEGALEAARDTREDEPGLALEALGASVDERNNGLPVGDLALIIHLQGTKAI